MIENGHDGTGNLGQSEARRSSSSIRYADKNLLAALMKVKLSICSFGDLASHFSTKFICTSSRSNFSEFKAQSY